MKRYICFLLAVFTVLPMLVGCGDDVKKEKSEFIFTENENGTLTVIGWSGLGDELTVPEMIDGRTVTAIGENAFRAVRGLTAVTLPDTVTDIDYAFVDCKSLKSVDMGDGIVTMNGAFMGCTSLESVKGGGSVCEMSEAFAYCTALDKAYIPSTVTYCDSAYKGCTALTEAVIEDGVSDIDYLFEGCTSLVSVQIPRSVKRGVSAFEGCTSLVGVSGELEMVELDCTFKGCTSLESLELTDGVKVMREAFVGCGALKEIKGLPAEVEQYSYSFTGCSSLERIVIPNIIEIADVSKYDITSDVSGCNAVKVLEINFAFMVQGEFCKTFSGLSSLEEMTLPQSVAESMLRVDSYYEDSVYTGDDANVYNSSWNSTQIGTVRISEDYGYIEGVSYTRVNGYEVYVFDPEDIESQTPIEGFEGFTKTFYWSGYPAGTNRQSTTVAIERVHTFHLRVTGKNDGSLPPSITINGISCAVDVMQS